MPRFLLGAALVALPLPAAAQEQPLAVHIETPQSGVVDGPVVSLTATVSDPSLRHATLVVNGAAYDVPVEQGRIAQQIVAIPGNNRVGVLIDRAGSSARDSLTFRYAGPPIELVVLLTWQSEGEIIDLWVREPGGETCKWDHRETESGGSLLDFSADAIGFGSQGYVSGQVSPGTYRLKIHYWGAFADDDQRAWYNYDDLLGQLDHAEEQLRTIASGAPERPALEHRAGELRTLLDHWAAPAPSQMSVHAEAILFPGTPYERRWRFDRVVHRTGELLTLGEVEIDDAMIGGAREAAR